MRQNLELHPLKKNPKIPTDFEVREAIPNNIIDFVEKNIKKSECPDYLKNNIFDSIEIYKSLGEPKHFNLFYRNSPASQILYPTWWRFNKMYNC